MRSQDDPKPTGVRMKHLQRADRALGSIACTLLQPFRWLRALHPRATTPAAEVERVLLIKFWGIGSLQLLTPAVAVLRRRHPKAEITLLTLASNAPWARGLDAFDHVESLDVACGWTRIFGRILRLVTGLRRARYDEVYDFEFFTSFSAVLSALSGAPSTHGFSASNVWRGGFHSRKVPFNRYWHVARNFRSLADGENGAPVTALDTQAHPVRREDRARIHGRLADAGFDPDRPYAVLNPNAGQLSLERRWPRTHFAALARRFDTELGLQVVLIGSKAEQAWTAGVTELLPDGPPTLDLSGQLDLSELCALIEGADLFVGNDSGPMHIAAALGAPTVGLFGPETPQMYAPLGERAEALYEPPPCSPCINVHDNKVANCIHGRPECLLNLTVDHVFERAEALFQASREHLEEVSVRPFRRESVTGTDSSLPAAPPAPAEPHPAPPE